MRDAAYPGSIADTLPTLLRDERLSNIIDTPARWSTSQLPSLRQAAAAWSRIMSLKDPLTGDHPIVKRLRTNDFYKSIFAVLCTGDAGSIDSLTDDDFPNIANLARRRPVFSSNVPLPSSCRSTSWLTHEFGPSPRPPSQSVGRLPQALS